ncbi:DUF2442 domain-containing protein [Rhizobium sp. Leaf371]|uniref:DUF2442 domain-containing protein n=1 Tax=Rhizobium sp. Leaf371 TaxID=1736355 RepID=UPI0009E7AB88|nr:DUF2442 domain-containing protein [Rhizobium sp. Leaf371]
MNGPDLTSVDDDDIIGFEKPLPRIRSATPLDARRVEIVWAGGDSEIVDLTPALASKPIFLRLRTDSALFATMRVSSYGSALEWDDGSELTAHWIRRLGPATIDNTAFRNAMTDLGMSLDGMAAALEISRRLVADYRKDKPIPRHIALATKYLVEHADL